MKTCSMTHRECIQRWNKCLKKNKIKYAYMTTVFS